MLTLTAVTVTATTDEETNTSNYTVLDTVTIPDNCLRVFKTSNAIASNSKVAVIDKESNELVKKALVPDSNSYLEIEAPPETGYNLYIFAGNIGSSYTTPIFCNETGGIYQKVRIKLSAFSSYFNEDGTHTETLSSEPHDYNFTDEQDGYLSYLVFVSGSAVTFAAPDQNGYVEIYTSAKLGEAVRFTTNFCENYTSAGKISSATLFELTVGDVDVNGQVTVADATKIQKYIAGLDTLDSLAARNSDINYDGVCNIADSTLLQKYLAGH